MTREEMTMEHPLTLAEIHGGTLELVRKIIDICEKLGIGYCIAYGTLLGAVRHQGFIPWDDDFDITMLRPDFEKFSAYCAARAEELKPFCLLSRKNTADYPFNIPRFCDLRYRMETDSVPDAGMGMFVDIYPLDGINRNFAENRWKKQSIYTLYKKYLVSEVALAHQKTFTTSSTRAWRTLIRYPLYCYAHLRGDGYFIKKLEKLQNLYPFDRCEYVGLNVWDDGFYVMEKALFQEPETLIFEGLRVKAPRDYDRVLRQCYGDYMRLPPEEKRQPHHEYRLYRKAETAAGN